MKTCNNCDKEIKWPEPYVKGNLPLNLDGSEHRCKSEAPEKQDRSGTWKDPQKQETLAGLEDLEKAEIKSNDPITNKIIHDQMDMISKIENIVKRHLVITQGENYSVQQLGLWVKLIYQNMSS